MFSTHAVVSGCAVMEETRKNRRPVDDKPLIYFGQTAATVRAHGWAVERNPALVRQAEMTTAPEAAVNVRG